jgi:acetylornithine deacetylase/succinyl-diaminopimelate desuccinylase-like protein
MFTMDYALKHVSKEEITNWLQKLIRIDTTNPPGNELQAVDYIREIFDQEGIEYEVLAKEDSRANLSAQYPGDSPARLLLSAHLDTVPFEENTWAHDPLSGKSMNGEIWGRGAVDCKGLVVMIIATLIELARSKQQLSYGINAVFLADEEFDGIYGAKFMVEEHPDKVNMPFVINEGGGLIIERSGEMLHLLNNAEKTAFKGRITVQGKPGHGSIPRASDNAIFQLAEVVDRLEHHRTRINPSPEVIDQIRNLGGSFAAFIFSHQLLADFFLNHPIGALKDVAPAIDAMIRPTIVPTVVRAGDKNNVIPGIAEIDFDTRVLPGQTWSDVEREVKRALGNSLKYDLNRIDHGGDRGGNASMMDTPLVQTINSVMNQYFESIRTVPFQLMGETDNRYFRSQFGSNAYGFMPTVIEGSLDEYSNMVHGRNERLSIKNLVTGSSILYEVVMQFDQSS